MIESILNEAILDSLASYSVLYVGYSGGLDSTVLLHALASHSACKARLHAVHVNHGLNPKALDWQVHCQQSCEHLNITFSAYHVNIPSCQNIEEQARILRYSVFDSLLTSADALLLAHHEDDQAETLLLNLIRGAGIDGLAAMLAVQSLEKGTLFRPLLTQSRAKLESYASHHGLKWIDDDSNQNERFSRNFLRLRVLPVLKEKWPSVTKTIARGAILCQQAKKNLEALAEIDYPGLFNQREKLAIAPLKKLPRERCLNVLRVWLKNNKQQLPSEKTLCRLVDELIDSRVDASPKVSFGSVTIRRYRGHLYCLNSMEVSNMPLVWLDFPSPIFLESLKASLNAYSSSQGVAISSSSIVEVRFRTGGERFYWHGQMKYLKNLMQEWHIEPWRRDKIPLIYVDGVLSAVVGYAICDRVGSEDRSLPCYDIVCEY